MPSESFSPKNTELNNAEQKIMLGLLKDQLKIAAVENPECANGGCGGLCGTVLCSKKVQGAINKMEKEIKKNTEE